jgi:hypothetical protein
VFTAIPRTLIEKSYHPELLNMGDKGEESQG